MMVLVSKEIARKGKLGGVVDMTYVVALQGKHDMGPSVVRDVCLSLHE